MKLINVPDLSPKDDMFTRLELEWPVEWVRLSGMPSNAFERNVKVLKLSRYRAAFQAAAKARKGDVVISHHPLMSSAVAIALHLMKRKVRHIAWAFNFTTLPTGARLTSTSRALRGVEKFVVFSEYEKTLYADRFGVDQNKFTKVLWAQPVPQIDEEFRPMIQKPYLCAIGGEGRDIDLVIEAAKRFEGALEFVVVTRPHMIVGKTIPDNVRIFTDLPASKTWALANRSAGVLVPLISDETCCGHITIVSAKLLGLPIVTTRSVATEEYVAGRRSILKVAPGNLDDFCQEIGVLMDHQIELQELASSAARQESLIHSRKNWSSTLNRVLSRQDDSRAESSTWANKE